MGLGCKIIENDPHEMPTQTRLISLQMELGENVLQRIVSVIPEFPMLNGVGINVVGRSGRCGWRGLDHFKEIFHGRVGINAAVAHALIVAGLLLGEDMLLRIQGFVLNFVRELISNILNIVGAVPGFPILLQNIFSVYNFKGDSNGNMAADSIVEGPTGITESLMKSKALDSDQLSVVGGTNCGGTAEFLLFQQNKACAVIQAIRLGRLIFC